jgi:hypothetical protein
MPGRSGAFAVKRSARTGTIGFHITQVRGRIRSRRSRFGVSAAEDIRNRVGDALA